MFSVWPAILQNDFL
jgi:SCY1-like protein 2